MKLSPVERFRLLLIVMSPFVGVEIGKWLVQNYLAR